jgi:hypothetical protein
MTTARLAHTATRLRNGQVLLTGGVEGGVISSLAILDTAELYDPAGQTFTALTMTSARSFHTAALPSNGRVLIAGGANGTTGPALDTAKIYAPASPG